MEKAILESTQRPGMQSPDGDNSGILKDFIHLLHEIVPLLETVRNSIEESSHRIPKATMQLSRVNEETENATVEILNVLETMTARITSAEAQLRRLKGVIQSAKDSAKKVTESFMQNASAANAYSATEITALVVNEILSGIEGSEAIPSIERFLRETKEDSMSIAMALQVQDIASQQIAGVAHSIEAVEAQLVKALERFERGTTGDIVRENVEEASLLARTFDVDARYTKSGDRQDIADEIVKQYSSQK